MKGLIRSGGKERGFTLVELLVSMLLTAILLGAVYSVYRVQARELKVQDERLGAQDYARAVADLMVREIRNAGFAPTGATCAVVVAADVQTLQFRYDANANGSCADTNEDIIYGFDTTACPTGFGNITRKEGANAAQPLTDCNIPAGTGNFSFTYYPKDSSTAYSTPVAAGSLGSVQRIAVKVTVQSKNPDPVFGGQLTATISSNTDLRNRGLPT